MFIQIAPKPTVSLIARDLLGAAASVEEVTTRLAQEGAGLR